MIELGHPWVIADRYTEKWPESMAGELVELVDSNGRSLAFALLDPGERIVARVVDHERSCMTREKLKKRLGDAIRIRHGHATLDDTDVYRLVNGEGDGFPGLTIDRYGDFLMLQLYSDCWRPYLSLLAGLLQELLSPQGIYEKVRPRNPRELEAVSEGKRYVRLLAGTGAPERLLVRENGLSFLVSLEYGLNTGLFPDQRDNRRDFMKRVRSKRVLNLFAHTGAFSVAAAAGGAIRVTSVDASQFYTDWAQQNFGANRLNPKRHQFIVGDCMAVMAELTRQEQPFDIVLMDPPSFSTTGKSRFTTRGGTGDLVAAALKLLKDGGLLVTSSNHQKIDLADYLKELRRGSLQAGCDLRVIRTAGQPEDFPYPVTFPEGRYLKYLVSVKCRNDIDQRG
jgi:23S rRNA (cytosine1962-C5)-methyltransferase